MGLDTYEEPLNQSALNGGWTPQGHVTGISLMHESGTGGGPKYGFPAQMPLTIIDGDVNLLDNRTYWQDRVCRPRLRKEQMTKSYIGWRRRSERRILPHTLKIRGDS